MSSEKVRSLGSIRKAGVIIAIIDLILAVNDSRNIGRFFLLLSMSSSQDLRPDNLIKTHCISNYQGICKTYDSISYGLPDPMIKQYHFSSDHQSKTVVLYRSDANKRKFKDTQKSPFGARLDKLNINLTLSYQSKIKRIGREANCGDAKLLVGNEFPQNLLMSLQQEVLTSWPCLMSTVPKCMSSLCNESQSTLALRKKEMKLHIDLKPFALGKDKQHVAATQQILFDYPWLSMLELQGQISGVYSKVFVAVSVYTWLWGTTIAILLLVGSLTGSQGTLHSWMIFNILYSLLLFMVDDWIHGNVNIQRSPAGYWFFIIYSIYKPASAWIGATQWFEVKSSPDHSHCSCRQSSEDGEELNNSGNEMIVLEIQSSSRPLDSEDDRSFVKS